MTLEQVRKIKRRNYYNDKREEILARAQAKRDEAKAKYGRQRDVYLYIKKPDGSTYRIKRAMYENV